MNGIGVKIPRQRNIAAKQIIPFLSTLKALIFAGEEKDIDFLKLEGTLKLKSAFNAGKNPCDVEKIRSDPHSAREQAARPTKMQRFKGVKSSLGEKCCFIRRNMQEPNPMMQVIRISAMKNIAEFGFDI